MKLSPAIVAEVRELTERARRRDDKIGISTVLRELIHIGLGHVEKPRD